MEEEKKIRIVIIEDEEPARKLISYYLQSHPEIEIADECADGFCGLKAIREHKPGLVFLDIQMPKLTGFEMLELVEDKPEIIFTTAYDEFAIKAFEMNAVDYLLKPYSQERFDSALNKAIQRIGGGRTQEEQIRALSATGIKGASDVRRIVVRKGSAITFIPVESILYIEAEDDYVMVWHKEGRALKQQTMQFYEETLPSGEFARIHRSVIVAIAQIDRIEPYGKDTHRVILKNGKSLPVSRSGYKTLREKIDY